VVAVDVSHDPDNGCQPVNEASLRSFMNLVLVLVLALPLACASVRRSEPVFDGEWSANLYQRKTPPKPRIPGKPASEHRHASSVPAMQLTASDGTGLALRRVQVRGVIDNPLSLTELHLTFENPSDQTLDGQFELLLPRGAEVSRFALMVGGGWVESEIVEREQAREVYQAHKHAKVDPALLERERGRRFTVRIFPIAPRERKQIIISYTSIHEQLGSVYRVPLAGLPRVDELDVQVLRRRSGAADEVLELHGEHQAPSEDFTVLLDGPSSIGLVADTQALLRLVPIPIGSGPAGASSDRPAGLTVLVDTSASMAGVAQASEEVLVGLLAALEQGGLGELPLELVAFDQVRAPIYRGMVADADARVIETLRARARLGASDLGAAIDAVDPSSDRVILIGDGEVSAGVDTRFELTAALERAYMRGVERLDAVVLGQSADLEQLDWLVQGYSFDPGEVFDASRTAPREWVDALLATPLGPVSIEVAGAKQVWPQTFDDLRPGQAVVVQASFARAVPTKLAVSVSGAASSSETIELQVRSGQGDRSEALVARSIALLRAKALMAEIEDGTSPGTAAASKRELVELSKKYGILTDYTAMLALESEQAYASYGIERGSAEGLGIEVVVAADDMNRSPGSTDSRDFTAVVDIMPTANSDAAGISLAGTTGAESRYVIDGSHIRDRRARRPARWLAHAEGSRIGARGPRSPAVRAFERQLDDAMQRCARHVAATDSGWGRVSVEILLGFDADAQLVDARIADTSDRPSALLDCTRYWLHELAGDGYDTRPRDAVPSIERRRAYRIEHGQGSGPAPSGWRSLDVIAHAAELAFEQQSGTVGWAKFIDEDITAGLVDEALDVAWIWHHARPADVLPYVSLGRALTACGKQDEAARAYGSLIDIQPMRAETRRFAGALLESVGTAEALALAIDSYRKARVLRPDHPVGYQALALALARHGEHREAVDVLVDALGRSYMDDRFGEVAALMRRDLATVAAAAILADPDSRSDVLTQLVDTMVVPQASPRDWITLSWETDASHLSLLVSDVEGRTYDRDTGDLALSESVRTGFGPQTFEWSSELPGPVRPWVQAYDHGPEGMAMGCLRRVRFDGEHQLEFDTRPFVIWPGQQRVSFGEFETEF
jgi:hypothetical protein